MDLASKLAQGLGSKLQGDNFDTSKNDKKNSFKKNKKPYSLRNFRGNGRKTFRFRHDRKSFKDIKED